MSSLFPIEKEISRELSSAAKELFHTDSGSAVWTKKFKNSLVKIAGKHDLEVWRTAPADKISEWLWDVCWVKLGRNEKGEYDWRELQGIFLACEIEWNCRLDYILEDFLKLTVSKAEYRLFVFACSKEADAVSIFDVLKQHCPGSEGARYMAIAVPDDWKQEADLLLPHCGWTI